MISNNKGITLVELLIVVVVMGIIAAFSVSAVGNIIENTKKDKVYADAMAVSDAVILYCISNYDECEPKEGKDYRYLKMSQLEDYIDGLDYEYYDLTLSVARIYQGDINRPQVRLRSIEPSDYSWYRYRDPKDPAYDRSFVSVKE